MNIFKYFPYHKTVSSIINGFCLYEGDAGSGGGSSDGSKKAGDGSDGSKAGSSGGNGNTIKLEDIPQEIVNQFFNKGFAKGKEKADAVVKEKLAEMGISEEKLTKWKKMDEDAEKLEADNLLKKGEFEKLKLQMVEQHSTKITELTNQNTAKDKTIHRLVVRSQIIAEAANDCVNPAHVADLIETNFRAEEINGEWHAVPYNGDIKLVDEKGEPQTVKFFIENWLKIEKNSYFKKSNVGQGGTGSQSSGSGYQRKDGKIDKKYQTPQGAIKAGLIGGSSILNKKGPIEKSE